MDSNELLSLAISVLTENRYTARALKSRDYELVLFEDGTLLGSLHVFSTVKVLIARWQEYELQFLKSQAGRLRSAGEKAWNVYSVFLTHEDANTVERREVRRIEENLERTRKLAMYAVSNRQVLIDSLLPLLPLQKKPLLYPEPYEERLYRRIAGVVSADAARDLREGAEPSTLLRTLREQQ